jgi:hypothetical protein
MSGRGRQDAAGSNAVGRRRGPTKDMEIEIGRERLKMRGTTVCGATVYRSKIFLCAAVWVGSLTLAAAQTASAPTNSGAGDQPSCKYGYYGYAPYACAPRGFYGPDYFFNGIFVGVGPWADWGYTHGWGEHRFNRGAGRAVVATAPASGAINPNAAANPSAAVKHESPAAATPAASHVPAPAAAIAHPVVVHPGAAVSHAGHGTIATGGIVASHEAAGGVHSAAGRSGNHPAVVPAHPNSGTPHSAHPPSGTYHPPAPSSSGQYHPPPASGSGAYHPPSNNGTYRY